MKTLQAIKKEIEANQEVIMKEYKTYNAAERNAEKRGLQIAEYGTLSSGKGYC